jgi:prevent-host-death family protein
MNKQTTMRTVAALEAKNRFGELLDTVQREPVTIEKHGRAVAVVLSAEVYRELEALKFEKLRAEIRKGLDDIEAGRTVDGRKVFRRLRQRHK